MYILVSINNLQNTISNDKREGGIRDAGVEGRKEVEILCEYREITDSCD